MKEIQQWQLQFISIGSMGGMGFGIIGSLLFDNYIIKLIIGGSLIVLGIYQAWKIIK